MNNIFAYLRQLICNLLNMTTYLSTPIKSMSKVLRPRERLLKYGSEYLELHELVAIVLRTGTKGMNVLEVAQEICTKIDKNPDRSISIAEMIEIPGISETKAITMLAAIELGKRLAVDQSSVSHRIESSGDCIPYLQDIAHAKKEHFYALLLDTKNQVIQKELISVGILDASLVHPREVFEPAIRHSASRIIVAHNHPSGDTTPSSEDIDVTRHLKQAGDLLGVSLLDHLVVGGTGITSIRDTHPDLFE